MAEAPTARAASSRDPLRSVARGSAVNVVGAGASAVATFLLTLALARALDADQAGAFFATTSLFLLLSSVGQLGTGTGLVYFIAGRARTPGSPPGSTYAAIAALPVLIVATVSTLVLAVAAGPLATWMGAEDELSFAHALWVLAVSLPLAAVLNLYTSASRGTGTMRVTVVLDQLLRPGLQVVLVIAVLPTHSLGLVVLAWSAPYLPTALGAWWWWHRRVRGDRRVDRAERRLAARSFWRFSMPRAFAGIAQLAMQRLDIVLVSALAGLDQAAVYTAATRFLVVGQLAGTALGRAVQPWLAEALQQRDLATAGRLYRRATGWLVLLAWPVYFMLGIFAATLLTVFGDGYADGATVLLILCATMLVATGCGMVDVVLTMAGRTSWNLYNVLFAFAVNLGLDVLLIPRLGILGAAIGWAAAILCNNLIPLAQVAIVVRLHPLGRSTLMAMATATVAFLVVPVVVRVTFDDGWIGFLVAGALGSAAYAGACLLLARQLGLTALWVSLRRRRPAPS